MPRMSASEKQKSHNRILDAAARLLREKGIGATSVSDVMQAAGLTHGGFYRHFTSKDDLVARAFSHAVGEVVGEMEAASPGQERVAAREQYIATYLSPEHVGNTGGGCPLAAMGAGVSRTKNDTKQEGAAAADRVAALLQRNEDVQNGRAVLAMLIGTIVLARLATTSGEARAILQDGQTGVNLLQEHW
ncbi:TetR/AcrR family transcriptional regulator [Ruegeria atlantica]|uniref:TetR/AcrR family transcriptional regulator n=1 Tax=Ruegeria atlantica TaxID=81569 RepID=UPI00147F9CAB|nr:TetR/AcrR family transcriptional regulator [Ruegeria atlantica]